MITLEEQFLILCSNNPSERGIAALVVNRSNLPNYREAVRQLVLNEKHHLPLMLMPRAIVEWNDNTLETLILRIHDERVLFTLLEAARLQKRHLPEESILRLLAHRSIFARLAALKQAIVARLKFDLTPIAARLSIDAENLEFVAVPNMPSPIFRHKSEFLRLLSGIQWIVAERERS
jgi:hypothetical protein